MFQVRRSSHTPITDRLKSWIGGCGAFYAITIASKAFTGLSTVKQHRLVTETLKKEIQNIHGLQASPKSIISRL
jgi:stress-induced morphogen